MDSDVVALLVSQQLGLLPDGELALLSSSATAKRRTDFARGRTTCRRLLQTTHPALVDAVVLRDPTPDQAGRPVVVSGDAPVRSVEVSISHARDLAAAAASMSRVGVDVVEREALGAAFRRQAFGPDEWQSYVTHLPLSTSDDDVDTIAFAFKEAALKVLGLGLRLSLLHVDIRPLAPLQPHQVLLDEVMHVACDVRFQLELRSPQPRSMELEGQLLVVDGCWVAVLRQPTS